jgi:hypothetical protein
MRGESDSGGELKTSVVPPTMLALADEVIE